MTFLLWSYFKEMFLVVYRELFLLSDPRKKVSALKYGDFILRYFNRRLSQMGGTKQDSIATMYRLDAIKMRNIDE